MKKYFCTFADSRMNKSLKRIEGQARDMKFFDEIYIYNENNLDLDFREEFKDRLIKGSRGYGYWVWKPQIILQTLKKMNEGDVLLYADAGCHLNAGGKVKLNEYFDKCFSDHFGIIAFQENKKSENPNLFNENKILESQYTKGDVFDFFEVRDDTNFTKTGQLAGGVLFIKKNSNTLDFFKKMLQIFSNHKNLINDSVSVSKNFSDFIEHRHDQSIFSILGKKEKITTISAYEIWQDDWSRLEKYPVLAKRDKDIIFYHRLKNKLFSFKLNFPLKGKIKKFHDATWAERGVFIKNFFNRIFIFLLPFLRLFQYPFVNKMNKKNILIDIKESLSKTGDFIRYRYYCGFKLYYSCSKDGTGIVNHVMGNRVYEPETCEILMKSLASKNNPSFVDVGANIGLISLYMLKNNPDMTIYAFEPSPHQYSLFKKTIKSNNIETNIKLSDYALSDTEGVVSFFAHGDASCSGDGFIDTGRGGAGDSIEVKTIPLDVWWKKEEKPQIDLIKIDTEGAELLVLRGAIKVIKQCKPIIYFEMQEKNYSVYKYSWIDIFKLLSEVEYDIFTDSGELFTSENAPLLMNSNYNFLAKSRTL